MAYFLTTTAISYRLEELIKNTRELLLHISPFLRINERLKEMLADIDRSGIEIQIIYGKNELRPDERAWLESLSSTRTGFCKNLHAKCYLNEHQALLTSMNLYEFSQVNNYEMGILLSKSKEGAMYAQVHQEAMRIVRASVETVENPTTDMATENGQPLQPMIGFCIRCRVEIPANPLKPYCKEWFVVWYKNELYEENHCHLCGKGSPSSLAKPACRPCFKKHSDELDFAVN